MSAVKLSSEYSLFVKFLLLSSVNMKRSISYPYVRIRDLPLALKVRGLSWLVQECFGHRVFSTRL